MHEPLAWEEIAGVETFEAESMTWVGLQLVEHKKSMPKMSWLVRLCAPLQHVMGLPRVSISLALLDGTPADLLAAVRALRPGLVPAARLPGSASPAFSGDLLHGAEPPPS
jgi:hypothetical protein